MRSGLTDLNEMPLSEVWPGVGEVEFGEDRDICWSRDRHNLFVSARIEDSLPLEQATRETYRRILMVVRAHTGFRICRMWNYINEINGEDGGVERYWLFNAGRAEAFEEHPHDGVSYPAACAVGCDGPSNVFLHAFNGEIRYFENPRQISSYRYPKKYGPRSPAFSRATLIRLGDDQLIHISGTASIEESESKHVGNLDKQLCTAIENIHTLLDSISAVEDIEMQAPTVLKIYVRRLADINRVREFVRGDFSDANIRFIRGDICRKELLVEIDGIVDLGRA